MQCDLAQQFFSDYITGSADSALLVTLEHHLASCSGCSAMVEELRGLWTTLDQLPVVEPHESFHAALMGHILNQQALEERPIAQPKKVWSLGRFFQPRVLAYAAVAIILLTSVELVQIQRASLGPLGVILSLMRPSPVVQCPPAEWTATSENGGVLTLHLKVRPLANGAENRVRYQVRLDRLGAGLTPTQPLVGEASSSRTNEITWQLDFVPSSSDRLTITVSSLDNTFKGEQSFPVTIGPAK